MFLVFFFGLLFVLYIFIKCFKLFEKYWRFNGVNIVLFFDDGWLIDFDCDICIILVVSIWFDLRKVGFIINDEKF